MFNTALAAGTRGSFPHPSKVITRNTNYSKTRPTNRGQLTPSYRKLLFLQNTLAINEIQTDIKCYEKVDVKSVIPGFGYQHFLEIPEFSGWNWHMLSTHKDNIWEWGSKTQQNSSWATPLKHATQNTLSIFFSQISQDSSNYPSLLYKNHTIFSYYPRSLMLTLMEKKFMSATTLIKWKIVP